ncbi:MAG: hypothetical protein AAF657_11225 [Acidobacteriota bacterium]
MADQLLVVKDFLTVQCADTRISSPLRSQPGTICPEAAERSLVSSERPYLLLRSEGR